MGEKTVNYNHEVDLEKRNVELERYNAILQQERDQAHTQVSILTTQLQTASNQMAHLIADPNRNVDGIEDFPTSIGACMPPTNRTVADEIEYQDEHNTGQEEKRSSVPWPGSTFILRCVSNGKVPTLLEGKIVLAPPGTLQGICETPVHSPSSPAYACMHAYTNLASTTQITRNEHASITTAG